MRQVPKLRLFWVVMSSELGNYMLLPLLTFIFFAANSPLFSSPVSMTKRSLLFGLCLSLYKISGVIGCTLLTALSDHCGRKTALNATLAGLLIVASCGLAALYLHSPALLIGGYVLVGLLDTNLATAPAIASDMSGAQNRIVNMATMQCVISLGACIGPVIGGQLANHPLLLQTSYAAPFLIASIIAVVSLILIQYCPETLVEKTALPSWPLKKIAMDYWRLIRTPHIAWLFLLLILCQFSWSSYYEFIPPTLKNIFHFSPAMTGWFVGLIAFWLIMASGVVIRLLLRAFNYRQLMWLSIGAVAFGTLLSLFASENSLNPWSRYALWFSPLPTAMGDVIFFSLFTGFLSQSVSSGQQGKAMGLTRTIATLVWSFTALLGGGLLAWHPNGALLFAPAGALVLLAIFGFSAQPFRFINRETLHDSMS